MTSVALILAVFLALGLAAFDLLAFGSMARDITPWSMATYCWIGIWGALGGVVSFAQKVRTGDAKWVNLSELFGEMFVSAFVGIVTGLLCQAAEFSQPLTWGLVAISGHAGGRALFYGERLMQSVGERWLGVKPDQRPIVAKSGSPADGS